MTVVEWLANFDLTLRPVSGTDTTEVLRHAEANLRCAFPADYAMIFSECDGLECYFSNGRCVDLWPITELVTRNVECEVAEYAPTLVIIGSTLSNGAIAIDRTTQAYLIVPFLDFDIAYADVKANTLLALCKELAARST